MLRVRVLRLEHQVRGVRCLYAIGSAELDDLVLEFLLLAAQADLIQQEPDVPRGPQLLDERIPGVLPEHPLVGL